VFAVSNGVPTGPEDNAMVQATETATPMAGRDYCLAKVGADVRGDAWTHGSRWSISTPRVFDQMPLTDGQTFAGYKIIRLLGSGGMVVDKGAPYITSHWSNENGAIEWRCLGQ